MGILDPKVLLTEDASNYPSITYSNVLTDESYFLSTLEYLNTMNEEVYDANKTFYKSLLESSNEVVINESFSDFFSKVKDIIKKFLKYLKSLFDRFVTSLHKIVKSDKYLIKHKDELFDFGGDDDFFMDIFTYTHLNDPSIPLAVAEDTFNSVFERISAYLRADSNTSITKLGDNADTEIRKAYDVIVDGLEDEYDAFRARVLGSATTAQYIYQEDFADDLFRVFRNNDDKKVSTAITSEVVNTAFTRFKSYDKLLKTVKETKTNIEKDYNNIIKAIDKMISTSVDGGDTFYKLVGYGSTGDYTSTIKVNQTTKANLNLIAKAQSNKVQVMCNIHALAMSAKLDAITEAYKQDKTVLYKVLSKVQKRQGALR